MGAAVCVAVGVLEGPDCEREKEREGKGREVNEGTDQNKE